MNYTVVLPSGARLTMLPPGTSEGAETNPECFRVSRTQDSGKFLQPRNVRGVAFRRDLHLKNSTFELPSGKVFSIRGQL
jgi:hypothetical protein